MKPSPNSIYMPHIDLPPRRLSEFNPWGREPVLLKLHMFDAMLNKIFPTIENMLG